MNNIKVSDIEERKEEITEMAELLNGVPKELRLLAKGFLLGVQIKSQQKEELKNPA